MKNTEKILLSMFYSGFIIEICGAGYVIWILKSESLDNKTLSLSIFNFIPLLIGITLFMIPFILTKNFNYNENQEEVKK